MIELRSWFIEHRDRVLHELHFRQREQEGQRRFGSLVGVDSIHVQRVVAAAGIHGVKFQAEVVPAQEQSKARCACSYHQESEVAR